MQSERLRKCLRFLNNAYDNALMAVLVALFLIISYCVYDSYYVYSHAVPKDITKYKPTAAGYSQSESPITQEMVGWLTIDGTNIDYPVMQADDNVRFVNTDPYGQYSLSGSIFLDYRNSPDFSDSYSVVYGHHMEYGKMFGALDKFLDKKYLSSHSSGTLIVGRTADKIYDLEPFCCIKTDAKNLSFFTPNDLSAVKKELAKNNIDVRKDSGKILALSTCAEGVGDERTVVFCYVK